jgi:hypothetical protein
LELGIDLHFRFPAASGTIQTAPSLGKMGALPTRIKG